MISMHSFLTMLLAISANAGGPAITSVFRCQSPTKKLNRRELDSVLGIESFSNVTDSKELCLRYFAVNSSSRLVSCQTFISDNLADIYTISPYSVTNPNNFTIKSLSSGKCKFAAMISSHLTSYSYRSRFHKQHGFSRMR